MRSKTKIKSSFIENLALEAQARGLQRDNLQENVHLQHLLNLTKCPETVLSIIVTLNQEIAKLKRDCYYKDRKIKRLKDDIEELKEIQQAIKDNVMQLENENTQMHMMQQNIHSWNCYSAKLQGNIEQIKRKAKIQCNCSPNL